MLFHDIIFNIANIARKMLVELIFLHSLDYSFQTWLHLPPSLTGSMFTCSILWEA